MMKLFRYSTVFFVAAALLIVPMATAAVETPSSDVREGFIIGDFLLCRPLGALATVLGSVVFVVSLPFSVMGDNTGQVADILVVAPARFTFDRPLGTFK